MAKSGLAPIHLTPEEGAANLARLMEAFEPVISAQQ